VLDYQTAVFSGKLVSTTSRKPNGPGHSDLIDVAQLSVERFAEGKFPNDPPTTLTSGSFDNQGQVQL
jgi:hypothetical protein